jgi:hypothetical protein
MGESRRYKGLVDPAAKPLSPSCFALREIGRCGRSSGGEDPDEEEYGCHGCAADYCCCRSSATRWAAGRDHGGRGD